MLWGFEQMGAPQFGENVGQPDRYIISGSALLQRNHDKSLRMPTHRKLFRMTQVVVDGPDKYLVDGQWMLRQ